MKRVECEILAPAGRAADIAPLLKTVRMLFMSGLPGTVQDRNRQTFSGRDMGSAAVSS